ncbi:MAG: hypothetical protein IT221_09885 [Fluviicola sp.]|nr:hypothetical protein [Fluviicola sp.]
MKKILFTLFACLAITLAKADSPLTSTPFGEMFDDEEIVKFALESNGEINARIMDYLGQEANPICLKLAVINALGWQFEGKNNHQEFLNYLTKTKKLKNIKAVLKKGSSHDIICLAYLKAMDNYFDVKEASKWSKIAQKKEPYSYSLHLVAALIQAQEAFDTDWCKVYQLTDAVRQNQSLEIDMRDQAYTMIFEYMDLYKDSCTEK